MEKELTTTLPKGLQAKIGDVIEIQKRLKELEQNVKDELLNYMTENNVISIKSDDLTVSLGTRTTYKAKEIPEGFEKTVLDQTRCANFKKLYGELPAEIEENTTKYITWRKK